MQMTLQSLGVAGGTVDVDEDLDVGDKDEGPRYENWKNKDSAV